MKTKMFLSLSLAIVLAVAFIQTTHAQSPTGPSGPSMQITMPAAQPTLTYNPYNAVTRQFCAYDYDTAVQLLQNYPRYHVTQICVNTDTKAQRFDLTPCDWGGSLCDSDATVFKYNSTSGQQVTMAGVPLTVPLTLEVIKNINQSGNHAGMKAWAQLCYSYMSGLEYENKYVILQSTAKQYFYDIKWDCAGLEAYTNFDKLTMAWNNMRKYSQRSVELNADPLVNISLRAQAQMLLAKIRIYWGTLASYVTVF